MNLTEEQLTAIATKAMGKNTRVYNYITCADDEYQIQSGVAPALRVENASFAFYGLGSATDALALLGWLVLNRGWRVHDLWFDGDTTEPDPSDRAYCEVQCSGADPRVGCEAATLCEAIIGAILKAVAEEGDAPR